MPITDILKVHPCVHMLVSTIMSSITAKNVSQRLKTQNCFNCKEDYLLPSLHINCDDVVLNSFKVAFIIVTYI